MPDAADLLTSPLGDSTTVRSKSQKATFGDLRNYNRMISAGLLDSLVDKPPIALGPVTIELPAPAALRPGTLERDDTGELLLIDPTLPFSIGDPAMPGFPAPQPSNTGSVTPGTRPASPATSEGLATLGSLDVNGLIGHEAAKVVCDDWADSSFMTGFFGPILAALLDGADDLIAGPGSPQGATAQLLGVLLAPSRSSGPQTDASSFTVNPYGGDVSAVPDSVARIALKSGALIGSMFKMVMQADLAELRDQAMASQSNDSTDTDRAAQSSDTTIEDVLADMERDPKLAPLAAKVKKVTHAADASSSQGQSVDDVLADMARNPQLAQVAAKLRAVIHGAPAAAPTPLAAGSLATVTEGEWRMLAAARKLLSMILEIVDAKTFRNLRDAVAQEMADTLQRAIEAEALAVACNQLPFTVRSKLKTGARIHEALQKRYESQFGSEHDIATELDDVGDDREKVRPVQYQTVFGPITNLQHVALAIVARDRSKDVDRFWQTLCQAFSLGRISMNRSLRADLVDHVSASIWEIKPISSASLGVWQEAAYRLSFNLLRELVGAMEPENSTPRLKAGGAITGSAAFRIYRPFPLSALTDPRGVIALPFHVSFLPGLLPYLLVKGPNEKQVAAAASVVLSQLGKRATDSLARKLAEFFAGGEGEPEFATALARAVAPILLPAIVVVLLVLAVLIFIDSLTVDAIVAGLAGLASMGAAAANFIGEAIENLGPGASLMRQGIGTLMPQSLRGLSPSLHFDRNGAATITFPAQSGEAALLTDVSFGSVAFRNVPQKDVGGLIVGFVTCFQALSDSATRRLETLGSAGGRVTSTAPQV